MTQRKLTSARVREMVKRQAVPKWGPAYVPAIRAARGEAPSLSKVSIVASSLLQRGVHALSKSEQACVALALYHPGLFELKEQHVMARMPAEHPLLGHPRATGMKLPTTTGTIGIAERLDIISQHPKVHEVIRSTEGTISRMVTAPWIGDLLLFLADERGPYCLSWDVKRYDGDHGKPGPLDWTERTAPRRVRAADARERVYVEYMRELNIRIVRTARSMMDDMLVINLIRLLVLHTQPIDLAPEAHMDLLCAFDEALLSGTTPSQVITTFIKFGIDRLQSKRVLEQAIWERRIRIDLFSAWSVDFPLSPEKRDPLLVHSDWFSR